MSSPWEDVRRESMEIPIVGRPPPPPPRASPLPWMLLTVSISMTIGVLLLGRVRIEEERTRTANALKANDELLAKTKALEGQLEGQKSNGSSTEKDLAEAKKQVLALELEKRRLQEELARRKK